MLGPAISTSATQQQGYHIHQEIYYYKLQTKDQKEREKKVKADRSTLRRWRLLRLQFALSMMFRGCEMIVPSSTQVCGVIFS
jgi:hypothetical protein